MISIGEHEKTLGGSEPILFAAISLVKRSLVYTRSFADGSTRYECVIFTLVERIAETEQYFDTERSIARSTSSVLIPSP